ncbi:MAG: hypothetical protein HGA67_01635 [Candidatus Yonathbacteria bacterium]|nr:hypothetical protein [Candidatus Yonathbacteria bacterium]
MITTIEAYQLIVLFLTGVSIFPVITYMRYGDKPVWRRLMIGATVWGFVGWQMFSAFSRFDFTREISLLGAILLFCISVFAGWTIVQCISDHMRGLIHQAKREV